ncbi:MAG: response regulator [Gammaproteobacteria bacterium]|nr:response regulator [Gammaproteobacteria bacterium]
MFKVLLVEDNHINQMVASKILRKTGMHVDIATNGLEALDLIKTNDYQLILMDCHMPKMDGFEATKKIRAMGLDMPVIALTASTDQETRELCFKAGMNEFISKPVRTLALTERVAYWLSHQMTKIG